MATNLAIATRRLGGGDLYEERVLRNLEVWSQRDVNTKNSYVCFRTK